MTGDELARRFLRNRPDRDKAVLDATAEVEYWVWTTENSERWWPVPLFAVRHGIYPGEDIDAEPAHKHAVERYGYNSDGQLRIAERYDQGRVEATQVVHWADSESTAWEDDFTGNWRQLTLTRRDPSGQVATSGTAVSAGWRVERPSYDSDGRLAAVRFDSDLDRSEISPARQHGEWRIGYKPDGGVGRVELRYDDPDADDHEIRTLFELSADWDELAGRLEEPLATRSPELSHRPPARSSQPSRSSTTTRASRRPPWRS